jgi:hypothetical protein
MANKKLEKYVGSFLNYSPKEVKRAKAGQDSFGLTLDRQTMERIHRAVFHPETKTLEDARSKHLLLLETMFPSDLG